MRKAWRSLLGLSTAGRLLTEARLLSALNDDENENVLKLFKELSVSRKSSIVAGLSYREAKRERGSRASYLSST